ncbi:hypothetical protein COCNU_07G014080 [Cocos nucifera]|uniref:SET domain-containing protein n=1 Tax=Cocos nucifera TaxID=13894 RepID=A0A8K0N5L2_COCNU|nr:hypothetical protein COCNU_07G014080 [Cocos nucifera]
MDGEEEGKGMAALLRWAAEMGISDSPTSTTPPPSPSFCSGHSLFVSHFPDAGGRGLAAARDLRKGELILRVPRAALLTSESVLKDERLASCVSRHPRLSSTQVGFFSLCCSFSACSHSLVPLSLSLSLSLSLPT